MKIFLIILILAIGIFTISQIIINMSTYKTETQDYKIIKVEDKFEIRYYPSATMAMISSKSKSYRDLGSTGFGTLAKYIFGGNKEKKQIAMTSPVHMDIADSVSTMAFVMPSKIKKDDLPKPNDAKISIKTTEPEYVAVIKFSGFASTENINKQRNILEKSLQDKGLSYHGNFRFLGYNPPFQIFDRRNEVIVALNPSEFKH